MKMILKPIKNEQEYDEALDAVDELMELDPELGSRKSDKLEVLILLIEKYEEVNWNIDIPEPVEAIKYRMEEMQLKQKDLIPFIGNKSKVSEVLNKKVELSLVMIRKLSEALHIPLEVLIQSSKKLA